jgi:hypothetical protein
MLGETVGFMQVLEEATQHVGRAVGRRLERIQRVGEFFDSSGEQLRSRPSYTYAGAGRRAASSAAKTANRAEGSQFGFVTPLLSLYWRQCRGRVP